MDTIILSIGNELLSGQNVDTNASWLAGRLTACGARVRGFVVCGDDAADLARRLKDAVVAADLVVATGGLGPTADDVTREAIATALGVGLHEEPQALAQIQEIFARWGRPMHPSNRRQAQVPDGASIMPNSNGTAPGICHVTDRAMLFAMPGVPSEMKAMFERSVLPLVDKRIGGAGAAIMSVACFGMSEAKLAEHIGDLMTPGRVPAVGTTASGGVITVRIVAHGASCTEATQMAQADVDEVKRRLGDVVIGAGGETLEGVVGRLLLASRKTVATAESCTGGLIAKRLTDLPGSSGYFLQGVVTYSNDAKVQRLGVAAGLIEQHGAVSEEVARAMASGCREAAGSDYALATTGVAGPGGGSPDKPVGLVYAGLACADGVEVVRLDIGAHFGRADVRDRAAKSLLNLLRLRLLETC